MGFRVLLNWWAARLAVEVQMILFILLVVEDMVDY
jgi:hypothetical protein